MKIRTVGKIRSGKKGLVKQEKKSHFEQLFGMKEEDYNKRKAEDEKFQKSQVADKDGWFVSEFVAENSGDMSVGIPPSSTEITVKRQIPLTLDDKKFVEDTLRGLEDLPDEKNDFFNPNFVGLKKDLIARDEARDKGMYEASRASSVGEGESDEEWASRMWQRKQLREAKKK